MKRAFNCGTGSGGFEPGNTCGGGGEGGGGGGNGGAGGGGSSARGERLRDRIEGTQAEADREVAKTAKQVRDIKAKIEQVKQRDPGNVAKQLEKKLSDNQRKQADISSKLQASKDRIAALKAQLKK
jgi:TolA-binding protein